MAKEIVTLTVKMPKMRMRAAIAVAWVLSPFVRNEATGDRVGAALLAWVQAGLRFYVNDRRLD